MGSSRARDWLRGFFEEETALPILFTILLGLALTAGALAFFECACAGYETGLCQMARAQPPWLALTGLAATPSAALTWYWRTAHQKRDLSLRRADVDIRARELERAKEVVDYERAANARAEVWLAIENLQTRSLKADAALATFQRAAATPALAKDALSATTKLLRTWDDEASLLDESPEDPEERSFRQRALETVVILRERAPDAPVNLRGASLYHLRLRGFDLRNADLGGALLAYADLRGAKLDGANLENVSANSAIVDVDADPTPEQALLLENGAIASVNQRQKGDE